jgi:HrpA-like RNA helicase
MIFICRRALCHGLFMNACEYDPSVDGYKLLDSTLKVKIHPSSCMSMSKPSAIVFTDLVMTAQLYARSAAIFSKRQLHILRFRDVTVVDSDWVRDIMEERKGHMFAS